ncbi:ATP synthase j chain-domain-containing protein [Xylariaceae sp. FL0594]|nr:ATP synthase j chain-domain-containing protein [Xylariaceae sp. FL0594]
MQSFDLGKPLVTSSPVQSTIPSRTRTTATILYIQPPKNTAKMMWFGITPLKKFPAPIMKPLAPFFAAGLIVLYGVSKAQNALMDSDEWKNDPRHPRFRSGPQSH